METGVQGGGAVVGLEPREQSRNAACRGAVALADTGLPFSDAPTCYNGDKVACGSWWRTGCPEARPPAARQGGRGSDQRGTAPADATDAQLRSAIQEGLRAGEDPVDIPASAHEEGLQPLLRAAGAKSLTAFTKDTRAAGISTTRVDILSFPCGIPSAAKGTVFWTSWRRNSSCRPGCRSRSSAGRPERACDWRSSQVRRDPPVDCRLKGSPAQ